MAVDPNATAKKTVDRIQEFHASRQVVHTTRTSSGQILDWIPAESQVPSGQLAAQPPPVSALRVDPERPTQSAIVELADERGPPGTVPVIRPDIQRLSGAFGTEGMKSRKGGSKIGKIMADSAPPSPDGYFHDLTWQSDTFYGWEGTLNVWDPLIDLPPGGNGEDHSILQAWLQNRSGPIESIEVGWSVDKGLNGDTLPHLFTFFTNDDYGEGGDDLGGYNSFQKGFVHNTAAASAVVYPACC